VGGEDNEAGGQSATIIGGSDNRTCNLRATVVGATAQSVDAHSSTCSPEPSCVPAPPSCE
jgi:hypothetical protein